MRGYLFDENLPSRVRFTPVFPVFGIAVIGKNPTDSQVWDFAREQDLVIVTKDADFSHLIILHTPPPRVVHLRFGNLRRHAFHDYLARVWPQVERLITDHKLVNVYRDRVEAIS